MNRSELGREIAYMQEQTKQIAGLAIWCINDAVAGLVEQDDQKAQAARLAECKTDLIYDEIRERFLVAVARQQPVAGDLRALVTALEIAAEVERIADYGNNIAKLYLKKISREEMRRISDHLTPLSQMAAIATDMLGTAIKAYCDQDAVLAQKVVDQDEIVDTLNKVCFETVARLMATSSPAIEDNRVFFHINTISRYIERVADRSTNIAEIASYFATSYRPLHTKARLSLQAANVHLIEADL